jgi:hypothetical protein
MLWSLQAWTLGLEWNRRPTRRGNARCRETHYQPTCSRYCAARRVQTVNWRHPYSVDPQTGVEVDVGLVSWRTSVVPGTEAHASM